jgi:hypothetical protein
MDHLASAASPLATSAGPAPRPPVACSRTTNDPLAGVPRNTAAGRRVADLFRAYVTALGNPTDTIALANALAAAELKAAAEDARRRPDTDPDQLVRLENLAHRAERRLGIRRLSVRMQLGLSL